MAIKDENSYVESFPLHGYSNGADAGVNHHGGDEPRHSFEPPSDVGEDFGSNESRFLSKIPSCKVLTRRRTGHLLSPARIHSSRRHAAKAGS